MILKIFIEGTAHLFYINNNFCPSQRYFLSCIFYYIYLQVSIDIIMNYRKVGLVFLIYTLLSKHGVAKEHLDRLKPVPKNQQTVLKLFGGGKNDLLK